MKNLLEKYLPVRSADGTAAGGGSDGGEASAGAGAAAAGAEGGDGSAGGSSAEGTAADAGGSASDAAAAGPHAYRPEGLPDTMFGKDDRETIDKLTNALKGYRDRDASKGIPDQPEAYQQFELEQAPEAIRPHLEQLSKDPLFQAVAKVAMEEKVPVSSLQKITTALYAQAQEAGILDYVLDVDKERSALLPESAKNLPKAEQDAAIDARMQANEDFIKLLTKPGPDGKSQLDPQDGEHALLMLMDTAAGNRFLEFVRAQMTGAGRAQPIAGQGSGAGAGQNTREALRERMAAPEMQPNHPKFNKQAYDQLLSDYQRILGD